MNAIDAHVHAFPDKLASRAITTLESTCNFEAVADGTIAALEESMDRCNVDASVVCPIATKAEMTAGILEWCMQIRTDRVVPLGSVHPDTPHPDRWIEKIAAAGLPGIKMHPMFQDFYVGDESASLDRIYDAANACGLIVELHCGYDISFPEDTRACPQRVAKFLDKHPGLKLVCMHLGGWRAWDDVRRYLIGRDVYLETSFSLDWMEPEESEAIIRDHGIERVVWGTDWPWRDQGDQIKLLRELPFTESQHNAILYGNAARLLGIDIPTTKGA